MPESRARIEHRVRHGDRIVDIAERYRVTAREVRLWNRSASGPLTAGATLVIFSDAPASRSESIGEPNRGSLRRADAAPPVIRVSSSEPPHAPTAPRRPSSGCSTASTPSSTSRRVPAGARARYQRSRWRPPSGSSEPPERPRCGRPRTTSVAARRRLPLRPHRPSPARRGPPVDPLPALGFAPAWSRRSSWTESSKRRSTSTRGAAARPASSCAGGSSTPAPRTTRRSDPPLAPSSRPLPRPLRLPRDRPRVPRPLIGRTGVHPRFPREIGRNRVPQPPIRDIAPVP